MSTRIEDKAVVLDLLKYHTNNKYHICEMLRMVYDHVDLMEDGEEKQAITDLLVDAMMSAKKMQDRLYYYQSKYHDDTGNKAQGIIGLTGVRARSKMRGERKARDENNR
jgi:hypothetical protein